jgi:hypothetical protein
MNQDSLSRKVATVAVAVLATVTVSDVLTYAATGSSLVLGKLNTAKTTTIIQNTGTAPALKLATKSSATAPMIVNGKGKVTNLYSDRAATADNATKLGGKTLPQIQTAAKGATGPKGAKGDPGTLGAQYGREIALISRIDTGGEVGWWNAITTGADGLPIISYHDKTSAHLKVAHCDNAACTTATSHTIDANGETPGAYGTSITIGADALPIVSYWSGPSTADLKVAHCDDITCTSSTLHGIDTTNAVGRYSSITIGADGLPLIAYLDDTHGQLRVAHCDDVPCASATTRTVDATAHVTPPGGTESVASITIGADHLPVLSYYDSTNLDLRVAHCDDALCTTAGAHSVDTAGDVGQDSSITIGADALPIISYHDFTPNYDLKVAHCNDTACTVATRHSVDTNGSVGKFTSIAIGPDHLPVIAYEDYDPVDDIKVAHCDDTACTTASAQRIDANGSDFFPSITIGADAEPIISYYEHAPNFDLKVAHLTHTAWAPNGWGR